MKRAVLLSCLLLWSMGPSPAIQNGTLRGEVVDGAGSEIPTVRVLIREDLSGRRPDWQRKELDITSDARGRFNVELSPGFYDVCVLLDAFTPTCYKSVVKAGDSAVHTTRLSVDQAVWAAIRDVF